MFFIGFSPFYGLLILRASFGAFCFAIFFDDFLRHHLLYIHYAVLRGEKFLAENKGVKVGLYKYLNNLSTHDYI
jgi:hypothetical protein